MTYNWLIDSIRKAVDVPEIVTFKDFLNKGFTLNKEDVINKFDIELTPWLADVADWVDDDETEWINLVQASQTGKTTLEMAFLVYVAQKTPTRVLWVQSTEEEAKQFISERLRPYIDNYDADAVNRRTWKMEAFQVFKARVKVGYATNEQSLRSLPAQYVIGDECAVWKHPIAMVKKRTRTFTGKRKGIFVTTPPRDGTHHSWKEACLGNFYRYYVPCIHCHEYQPLVLAGLKWCAKEGDSWDLDKVKASAYYECTKCKKVIYNNSKLSMIKQGKLVCVDPNNNYIETVPKNSSSKTLQISALYSTFTTWGETAVNFLNAKHGGMDTFKIFITDELAEVPINVEQRETLYENKIAEYIDTNRTSGYLPGYTVYTAGIDVQRNGDLYVVIIGWKSDIIPTPTILGYSKVNCSGGHVVARWKNLFDYLAPYQKSLARVVLDSTDGMMAQDVYDFCNYAGKTFMPLKDSTTLHTKTYVKTIIPEVDGKKIITKSQTVLVINSDKVKDDIAASFSRSPGEAGAWSFPSDTSNEFVKHMVSENRIVSKTGKSSWSPKYSHAPNHFFSALTYAFAAMEEFRLFLQQGNKDSNVNRTATNVVKSRVVSNGYNMWR